MATVDQKLGKELLALEKQYWNAIQKGDVETAMRLSDDPCIVTGAQGIGALPRSAIGAMMKEAGYTLRSFKFDDDIQVHKVDDDVAVLAYKVHEELTVDGKPVTVDAAEASTWVRRNGSWVCALHTESILGDPFGRDRHA